MRGTACKLHTAEDVLWHTEYVGLRGVEKILLSTRIWQLPMQVSLTGYDLNELLSYTYLSSLLDDKIRNSGSVSLLNIGEYSANIRVIRRCEHRLVVRY